MGKELYIRRRQTLPRYCLTPSCPVHPEMKWTQLYAIIRGKTMMSDFLKWEMICEPVRKWTLIGNIPISLIPLNIYDARIDETYDIRTNERAVRIASSILE